MWIRELLWLCPALEGVVDAMLPKDTRMEDDGTGAGRPWDGDNAAITRSTAKRAGQDARTEARAARRRTSADKRSADVAKASEPALGGTFTKLTPLLENLAPKPSAARLRMEEAESASARLALSKDLLTSYKSCMHELEVEKAKGEEADQFIVAVVQKRLDKIKKRMEEDAEEAL